MSYWQILGLSALGVFTIAHLLTTFYLSYTRLPPLHPWKGLYTPFLVARLALGAGLVSLWLVLYTLWVLPK